MAADVRIVSAAPGAIVRAKGAFPPLAQVIAEDYKRYSFTALLDVLTKIPGTISRVQNGWLVVQDDRNRTVWYFAPVSHVAYPAYVRRSVVSADGRTRLDTEIKCESAAIACQKLVEEVRTSWGVK